MTTTRQSDAPGFQVRKQKKRPLLLAVLCFFTWIFYAVMASFFLLALFYSGWITDIINQYIPDGNWTKAQVSLLFLGLFVLHGTAFSGIILLWNGNSTGYILFSIPTILITVFHLFRPEIPWFTTAIYAILVILFGFFSRQSRHSKDISN